MSTPSPLTFKSDLYTAFIMIFSKLSDIWGLRKVLLGCTAFFLIFSIACGVAQTMNQLYALLSLQALLEIRQLTNCCRIVLRAFQGIGGSGIYSLVFVTIMKLVTAEKLGFYSGIISSVFAISNLLGPILGGAIADNTTWRWIFWMK